MRLFGKNNQLNNMVIQLENPPPIISNISSQIPSLQNVSEMRRQVYDQIDSNNVNIKSYDNLNIKTKTDT